MKRQEGFTLLEVLLAVGITALIGVGAYYLFDQAVRAEKAMKARTAEFSALQRTVSYLEDDLMQAVPRPVRGEYGETLFALTSRNILYPVELTRTGWSNFAGGRRSELQRVAYQVKDGVLYRLYWRVLDRAQDTLPREQALLKSVGQLRFRFMDAEGAWHDDWPSLEMMQAAGNTENDVALMPRAVEFTLETDRFGTIRRILELAQPDPGDEDAASSSVPGGNPSDNSSGAGA